MCTASSVLFGKLGGGDAGMKAAAGPRRSGQALGSKGIPAGIEWARA